MGHSVHQPYMITARQAHIPQIFAWFKEDFNRKGSVPEFVNRYASAKIGSVPLIRDWFGLDALSDSMEVIVGKVHPQDRSMVAGTLARSLQSEGQSRHDVTYRVCSTQEGGVRHLRSIGKTTFTAGNPHAVTGIIQDVTPQVEARFRTLVESAHFAIGVYVGRKMRIQFANQAMLEAYRVSAPKVRFLRF